MTITRTVQDVAKEMLNNMEQKTRNDGKSFYCCKNEIEWQQDIIREAHGDKLPDDYVYEFTNDALCVLSDCDEGQEDDAIYEIEADCYTSNLTEWLNSRCDRVYYLTEVLEEFQPVIDGFAALTMAQQKEKQEVAQAILSGIKEYIENLS